MCEKSIMQPTPVDFDVAVQNFKTQLAGSEPLKAKTAGKQQKLERYIFGNRDTVFWKLIDWYKSVMPLTDPTLMRGFYKTAPDQEDGLGKDSGTDTAAIKKDLNRFCELVNAFCGEGVARQELLDTISTLYEKKLTEKYRLSENSLKGLNLIVELRNVIKENMETLLKSAVRPRHRPSSTDFCVSYLLEVFKHSFPEEQVSRGGNSFCYNFILEVLKACAPDSQLEPLDKISKTLGSRIKNQQSKPALFVYSEAEDRFKQANEFEKRMERLGS